jgi:hypothetical protein
MSFFYCFKYLISMSAASEEEWEKRKRRRRRRRNVAKNLFFLKQEKR